MVGQRGNHSPHLPIYLIPKGGPVPHLLPVAVTAVERVEPVLTVVSTFADIHSLWGAPAQMEYRAN